MDAFVIRHRLIAEYSLYVRSFINIREPGIREHVQWNRREKMPDAGSERLRLCRHRHQEDGIRSALDEQNYVLTIGAASGKSLSHIAPIVDPILRKGARNAIQAIVVYLTDSQAGELKEFLVATRHFG